jgi:hypothetical protein
MRSRTFTAAALVAAVALTGCGGGKKEGANAKNFKGDQKDVAQLVDDLQAAARAGDTGKICQDLFTRQLASAVGTRGHTTCQAQVKKQLALKNETITITQLAVQTPSALATVQEQNGKVSRLTFLKQSGKWHVNGIQ